MTGSTAPCIFVWEFQQSIKNRARDSESQHWLPKSGSRIWFWVCWLKWQKLLEWCVPPHRTPVITSPPSKLCVCMCVWGADDCHSCHSLVVTSQLCKWPPSHSIRLSWTNTNNSISHTYTHIYSTIQPFFIWILLLSAKGQTGWMSLVLQPVCPFKLWHRIRYSGFMCVLMQGKVLCSNEDRFNRQQRSRCFHKGLLPHTDQTRVIYWAVNGPSHLNMLVSNLLSGIFFELI